MVPNVEWNRAPTRDVPLSCAGPASLVVRPARALSHIMAPPMVKGWRVSPQNVEKALQPGLFMNRPAAIALTKTRLPQFSQTTVTQG